MRILYKLCDERKHGLNLTLRSCNASYFVTNIKYISYSNTGAYSYNHRYSTIMALTENDSIENKYKRLFFLVL